MRIGVCGGPYGNPYALRAFVADARRRGCVRLFCLGDLGGFGAEVNELWPILVAERVECIAGNYDIAIARADPDCGCGYRDPSDNHFAQLIYDHTLGHTSRDFADWMGRLRTERRETLARCTVHLVHGSPLAINDFWWESLPEAEHRARAAASGADVVVCTHTGFPWRRRVGPTLAVNVGVLGKPANDGRTEVWYVVLDLVDGHAEAELVPLAYDWAAQASSMRAAGLPEPFVETIETGWWTTCLEVLPPAERAAGRYHLYRSALPRGFRPPAAGWGSAATDTWSEEDRPVVGLFGTAYFPSRLWVYTNFHCNLRCDYCAVGSAPLARGRSMPAARFGDLVDEAVGEGFTQLCVTGGEPFLHPDIVEMLRCAAGRLPTVVLTNAMLFGRRGGEALRALAGTPRLVIQTSLDGARPDIHDAHRGRGSWFRTMDGIRRATGAGLPVRVAMTRTPDNAGEVPALAALVKELGLPPEGFAVRPLLRRGFSDRGLEIGEGTTVPELTVTTDGLHWHPAAADLDSSPDMLLARGQVPLRQGKRLVVERFFAARLADGTIPKPYRCAV